MKARVVLFVKFFKWAFIFVKTETKRIKMTKFFVVVKDDDI
jgi:hypothetical protein